MHRSEGERVSQRCRGLRPEMCGEIQYYQCWEGYFGNVIGYRLQVTLFKM